LTGAIAIVRCAARHLKALPVFLRLELDFDEARPIAQIRRPLFANSRLTPDYRLLKR
jgi:hypothetical protein